MPASRKRKSGAGRGKRPRQKHWIYDVERALGLNHSDIARLLTPEHLTPAAIRDICKSRSGTPALQGLEFPIKASAVSDIIAGESEDLACRAEVTLWCRLGVLWNEYSATGEILGFERLPLGKDSLVRYLADEEQSLKKAQQGVYVTVVPLNRVPPQFSDQDDFW